MIKTETHKLLACLAQSASCLGISLQTFKVYTRNQNSVHETLNGKGVREKKVKKISIITIPTITTEKKEEKN